MINYSGLLYICQDASMDAVAGQAEPEFTRSSQLKCRVRCPVRWLSGA